MTQTQPKKQIGELLKEKGLISEEHIGYALQEQKITKEKLGELFERLGFVTENDLVKTLAEQSGLEYMDVDEAVPDEAVLKLFNKNLCVNNIFLPIRRVEQSIVVAVYNVMDDKVSAIDCKAIGAAAEDFYLRAQKNNQRHQHVLLFFGKSG